jgi:hypothetical protein
MGIRERITASVTDIRTRGQKLVELNVELLKAELKKKVQEYGGAIGMLAAAGLLALYALGFLLATITVALALFLPTWLALLVVTLVLLLIIAILVLAARSKLQKLQAAPPSQAPAEAKTTIATVKDGAARTAKSLRPTKKAAPQLGETPAPAASWSRAPETSPDTPAPSSPAAPATGETPPDDPPTEARP